MAKKTAHKAPAKRYTKPKLREQLKRQITAGSKGGKAGQWSARKAQMLAAAYKKEGGGYAKPKASSQKHLDQWTDERWTTSDGDKAVAKDKTKRYLPQNAWAQLTPAQKRQTNAKKEAASKSGKQFVANTPKAKAARKKAVRKTPAKTTGRKTATTKKKTSQTSSRKQTTKAVTKRQGAKRSRPSAK